MIIPDEYVVKHSGQPVKGYLRCLYCGAKCLLCCGSLVYHGSKRFGCIWVCPTPGCDAYVGCHKRTHTPLGNPANYELRELRRKCHYEFDPLWEENAKTLQLCNKGGQPASDRRKLMAARNQMYKRLADYMNLPIEMCHIAMFHDEQCYKVLEFVKQYKTNSHDES